MWLTRPSLRETKQGLRTGTWRLELKWRPWTNAAYGLLLNFLVQPRATCPALALPTVRWILPCQP